jgi:RNA polymerase sigma-70 factor (ECF subfamily)
METLGAIGTARDSDGALVAAAKCGDREAFEQLVIRYKRRAFSAALRITNNREDAEDVVQETFHKVFLHLTEFQEKSQFSTWLIRITMNEALMLLRRRRRVAEIVPDGPDDDVQSGSIVFVDDSPDPEESCWRRERTELLIAAIGRLGPAIRRTMLLRDIEERSVKETAQILGVTTTAVKARVHQGRRKLGAKLDRGLLQRVYGAG